MPRDVPEWLRKEREERAARLATLTPAELAERQAFYFDRAADRARRQAARVKVALFINQRAMHGDKLVEIAGALGITTNALRARRWGHALFERKGYRRLPSWVSDKHVTVLDALAKKWGMTREKALSEIVETALTARARTIDAGPKETEAVA